MSWHVVHLTHLRKRAGYPSLMHGNNKLGPPVWWWAMVVTQDAETCCYEPANEIGPWHKILRTTLASFEDREDAELERLRLLYDERFVTDLECLHSEDEFDAELPKRRGKGSQARSIRWWWCEDHELTPLTDWVKTEGVRQWNEDERKRENEKDPAA